MQNSENSLQGKVIALAESRQLDVLVAMLEKRGATVWRCPLVSILDSPDRAGVETWLEHFITNPPDELILLTGEGLRRLCGFAERAGRLDAFIAALQLSRKIVRGPKPGQALKEIDLKPELLAAAPTTEGIIETLESLDIKNHRIGVQLYGQDPNMRLIDYLRRRGATVEAVSPYIYADDSDENRVVELIDALASGRINAIAFTSQPQYKRLADVARKLGKETELKQGLDRTVVAAVGPVVAAVLEQAGVRVDMMPETSFFMKPMVTRLAEVLGA
jgi:uroporphyrinogen-III synthase